MTLTALLMVVLFNALPQSSDVDGKAVFQAKCASCHSVESVGIAPGHLNAVLNIDWKRTCKDCSADLSGLGERRTDAKWLKAYLKGEKKGRNGLRHNELPVTLNGDALIMKDGPGQFTLTDAEGDALVKWLLTLRRGGSKVTSSTGAGSSAPSAVQPTPAEAASLLLNARTVAVIGNTGVQLQNRLWANPSGDRAKEKVEAVLKEWGKYQIVDLGEHPDMVIVVLESQKNLSLFKRANLVAELKVHRGGQELTDETPVIWSGEAAEGFSKLPATKVAEMFRDYVMKLPPLRSETP
jgi:hypothetical protein